MGTSKLCLSKKNSRSKNAVAIAVTKVTNVKIYIVKSYKCKRSYQAGFKQLLKQLHHQMHPTTSSNW